MDQLAHLGAHIFEVVFFFGIVGSVVVVLTSVVEDIHDAMVDDEEPTPP